MKEIKKCNGAHCRCMNIGGSCPHMHYAECVEHNPALASKPTPHTDQFEEIVKEFDSLFVEFGNSTFHSEEEWQRFKDDENDPHKVKAFWIAKLHHIRRETEKGMMEKVKERIKLQEFAPKDEANRGYTKALHDILSHLESDNSTKK